MVNLYKKRGVPYVRNKISWLQYHRGIILRNEMYVGIYVFERGKEYIRCVYDLTCPSSDGYRSRFRVYSSYAERMRSTLYAHMGDYSIYEEVEDLRDLVICSELYAIPTFMNWKDSGDREILLESLLEGGNFLENVQRHYAEYLRFN
ncbi:MAG: hypothetical protein ACRDD8_06880 [Bacteroidales bacterium]